MISRNALKFNDFGSATDRVRALVATGKCRLVSIDVFDTAVFRRCVPELIVESVCREVGKRLDQHSAAEIEQIRRKRESVYFELAENSRSSGRDPDIDLATMCLTWAARLLPGRSVTEHGALADFMLSTEAKYEIWACEPNLEIRRLVTELAEAGHRVIYCSDMYLGQTIIERILSKCGYDPGFSHGYVSGDHQLLKRTGRLFEHVLESEGISPAEMIHVGDDPLADGERPTALGIASITVRSTEHLRLRRLARRDWNDARRNRDWFGPLSHRYACWDEPFKGGYAEAFGMALMGPVVGYFALAMAEYCSSNAIDRIYFLSREGLVLKGIFNEFAALCMRKQPDTEYLYVSRLSTGLAAMRSFGLREMLASLAANGKPTARKLLTMLSLDDRTLASITSSCGLPGVDAPLQEPFSPEVARLLAHPDVTARAAELGENSRVELIKYLEGIDFFRGGRVALVDVGWGLQIQESLELAIQDHAGAPEIHGLYLGVDRLGVARRRAGVRAVGLLADAQQYEWFAGAIFDFVHLFEVLTRAPHGTVLGYEDGHPCLAASGTPARAAEEPDDSAIVQCQTGMRAYAAQLARFAAMTGISSSEIVRHAATVATRVIRFPRVREVEFLLGFENIAHLGSNDSRPLGYRARLTRPLDFFGAINRSLWSEGAAVLGAGRVGAVILAVLKSARISRRLPAQQPVNSGPSADARHNSMPTSPHSPSPLPQELSSAKSSMEAQIMEMEGQLQKRPGPTALATIKEVWTPITRAEFLLMSLTARVIPFYLFARRRKQLAFSSLPARPSGLPSISRPGYQSGWVRFRALTKPFRRNPSLGKG
ncbi:MAG: hypothetical protein KDG50_09570 [Chromatiales bacterium]|nr:hypothetical protein [Chromatiales bacterium]